MSLKSVKNKFKKSKKKYSILFGLKKKSYIVVEPTKEELRIIEKGRRDIEKGDFISWEDLKKELGV